MELVIGSLALLQADNLDVKSPAQDKLQTVEYLRHLDSQVVAETQLIHRCNRASYMRAIAGASPGAADIFGIAAE